MQSHAQQILDYRNQNRICIDGLRKICTNGTRIGFPSDSSHPSTMVCGDRIFTSSTCTSDRPERI